jgi:hypothetical protein
MKYNKTNDAKQDAKTKKGLDKEQKVMFEKMDKKHRKPKSQEDDRKMDVANKKKIKAKEKAHEAKEGKKGEKAEDKREKKSKKK